MWNVSTPILALIGLALVQSDPAFAQVPTPQEQALFIRDVADAICGKVELSGSATNADVRGEITAKLRGLSQMLARLGGSAESGIHVERYENVLRQDLPDVVKHGIDCRKWVFDKLLPVIAIAGSQPTPAAQTTPAAQPTNIWPVGTGEPSVDSVHASLNSLPTSFDEGELVQALMPFFSRPLFDHPAESFGTESSLYAYCRGQLLLDFYFPRFSNPAVRQNVSRATQNLVYVQDQMGRSYGPNFKRGDLCAQHSQTLADYRQHLPPKSLGGGAPNNVLSVLTEARKNLFAAGIRPYP